MVEGQLVRVLARPIGDNALGLGESAQRVADLRCGAVVAKDQQGPAASGGAELVAEVEAAFAYPPLREWARKAREAARDFDMDGVKGAIDEYPSLARAIRGLV